MVLLHRHQKSRKGEKFYYPCPYTTRTNWTISLLSEIIIKITGHDLTIYVVWSLQKVDRTYWIAKKQKYKKKKLEMAKGVQHKSSISRTLHVFSSKLISSRSNQICTFHILNNHNKERLPWVELERHQYDEIFEQLRWLPFASEPLLWPSFPSEVSVLLFPSSPSALSLASLSLFSVQNPSFSVCVVFVLIRKRSCYLWINRIECTVFVFPFYCCWSVGFLRRWI